MLHQLQVSSAKKPKPRPPAEKGLVPRAVCSRHSSHDEHHHVALAHDRLFAVVGGLRLGGPARVAKKSRPGIASWRGLGVVRPPSPPFLLLFTGSSWSGLNVVAQPTPARGTPHASK